MSVRPSPLKQLLGDSSAGANGPESGQLVKVGVPEGVVAEMYVES
jgi:hypothetical protein